MSGKVYIASMNLIGTWATSPPNTKKVNVTSAQRKDHKFRLAFSPMTPIQNKYKGYYCFENYWQSGKRYQDIDSKKVTDWWKKQNKGRRRYPDGKGKQVLYAKFPHINENLGYIESRSIKRKNVRYKISIWTWLCCCWSNIRNKSRRLY